MKAVCFFLVAALMACSNNNDGNVPQPTNLPDRTDTDHPKDTNRLEAPVDTNRRSQGALHWTKPLISAVDTEALVEAQKGTSPESEMNTFAF